MKIRPVSRYILERFLYYLGVSFLVYLAFYLIMVLPFKSGASPEELEILKALPVVFGVIIFTLSLYVQIQNIFYVMRESISIGKDTVEITTGAISLSTTNIPLSQIEYANTSADLLDSIFGTATISIGSDTVATTVNGFDRKEAIAFAETVSANQKIKIKTE